MGGASLDSRGLIVKIYVGLLDIATYQIYKLWASWFQRIGFLKFINLWKLLTPDAGPVWTSGDCLARFM